MYRKASGLRVHSTRTDPNSVGTAIPVTVNWDGAIVVVVVVVGGRVVVVVGGRVVVVGGRVVVVVGGRVVVVVGGRVVVVVGGRVVVVVGGRVVVVNENGITELEAAEGELWFAKASVATTENVYGVPAVSPVTFALRSGAFTIVTPPPGVAVTLY
jgi:hypothetical protein